MHVIVTCEYEKVSDEKKPRKSNNSVFGPNFELLRALVHVIITCKHEKDRMKNSLEKWQHRLFGRSRAGNSVVRGWIWPNFELI